MCHGTFSRDKITGHFYHGTIRSRDIFLSREMSRDVTQTKTSCHLCYSYAVAHPYRRPSTFHASTTSNRRQGAGVHQSFIKSVFLGIGRGAVVVCRRGGKLLPLCYLAERHLAERRWRKSPLYPGSDSEELSLYCIAAAATWRL